MIYCVIPEALADQLKDKLTDYYKDDPNVEVIIDRRKSERRERGRRWGQARAARPPPPARSRQLPQDRRLTLRLAASEPSVVVHVDGGSRGNPGPAGIGVVITDPDGASSRAPTTTSARRRTTRPSTTRCCWVWNVHALSAPARSRSSTTRSSSSGRSRGEYRVKKPELRDCSTSRLSRCSRASRAGPSARSRASRTSSRMRS